jgi:DNA-binding MarR family transcriptional regulator
MQAETLAGLLSHLGRAGEPERPYDGLTPAQLSALRYLARANPMSRTASALAAYQATTRGTVSQTVKALVRAGYLERTPLPSDRRSVRLDLTSAGWAALLGAPDDRLVVALARLPEAQRRSLAQVAIRLNGELAEMDADSGFGTCPSCRYLVDPEGCARSAQDGESFYCCQAGCELTGEQLHALCAAYQPRADGAGIESTP